jgi:DNA-binding response OmpR family regulator
LYPDRAGLLFVSFLFVLPGLAETSLEDAACYSFLRLEEILFMHILVVEDEERLALLLRRILTGERYTVDLANTGNSGLDLALSGTYDLVMLDVMLPDIDGMEICRQMRANTVMTPVLMLTARGSVEDRVDGLNVGADDYLVKPFVVKELLARVNEARRGDHMIDLTAKEFALLEYMMRHPNQVLTRNQIIDYVWRYDTDALSNVVDIYIHFLREKIDQGFGHSLIKTVRGVGYKIVG